MKPFRERNPVIIGAISILALALLLVGALNTKNLPIIGGGDIYYAEFTEAGGLQPGDEIRLAGVRVGSVDSIELADGKVRVQLRVTDDSRLGKETGASIRIKTLLGSMYVALAPDGGGELAQEATIPVSRTESPFDTVEAFEGLADTAGRLDTDQLARSLTVLADLTRNTPEEFKGTLTGLSRLSTNLADRDDQINSLLVNLRRFSGVLNERDDDLVELMRQADTLFEALVARRDDLHRVLLATSRLSKELTTLIRQSRGDLKPALDEVENVLDVLNKNEDNLDDSLKLLAPFYRVFANTLGTGPWFDTYIANLPNPIRPAYKGQGSTR